MNIKTTTSIDNNIYEGVVEFSGYGTNVLSEEQEIEILTNFPVVLQYADTTFQGKFKVDGKKVVLDNENGVDTVELSLINQVMKVDDTFRAVYTTDATKVLPAELGIELDTREKLCEARVTLFIETIKAKVSSLLQEARDKMNDFEAEKEETL